MRTSVWPNSRAVAGATWVVDDNMGIPHKPSTLRIYGEDSNMGPPFPYTDPEGPFNPPNSETPWEDYMVFKPVYMPTHSLGGSIIINTGAGIIEGSEKVFVRQWYEPEYPEPRGMVWTEQDTVLSADIVTEYSYMLLDLSNVPVAGIPGGTHFWLPIGSEFGASGDQIGLDSFVVDSQDQNYEMVMLTEVGDFNGDGLKDINIATRDEITSDPLSTIQFMDHAIEYVGIEYNHTTDNIYAVVNLYYLGNDDPEQIGTGLHLEVGGPMVVAGRSVYQNPGTPSFCLPWYLEVEAVRMMSGEHAVVYARVGRLLHMGETFFADGAEYDIAMIYGPTADSFRYITIRNPTPKLGDVWLDDLSINKEHVDSSTELPLLPPVTKEYYSVGEGAPTEEIKNHFIDAYNRNGGATVLGSPTTEVHRAWGYLVQDFPGTTGYAGGIIMYNPYKNYAYYIHGAIWERYYGLGGPRATTDIEFELGPPVSDIEPYIHTLPPEVSSHGTQFRYQNFEGGALEHNVDTGEVFEVHGAIFVKWKELGYADDELGLVTSDEREAAQSLIGTEGRVSDFEGGHIHWHRTGGHGGKSYETHGAIDAVYCAEGGSGGRLGFPVSDEYVNPSGYPQSDFEGGYITTTDGVNYYAYMNDDTDGPVLEITSPADGFHTDKCRIDISGTASDGSDILNGKVEITLCEFDDTDVTAKCDPETDKWNTNIPLVHGNNVIKVVARDNKHNPTEKTISVYCNLPDISFAHITDVHTEQWLPGQWFLDRKLKYIIYELNNDYHLKFVLVTGDIVEYDDEKLFNKFLDVMNSLGIVKYYTPGNHDRRNKIPITTNLDNYNAIIKPKNGPSKSLEDGYGDYYFDRGGYRFIGLDSGHDFSVLDLRTPEGSGLEDDQYMRLLESDMEDHPKKIIFMHHPVINEENDGLPDPVPNDECPEHGGNDMCIAAYRCGLINYCIDCTLFCKAI